MPRRLILLTLLLAGCSSTSDLLAHRTGRNCIVRVRPASLGASGSQPVPVNIDSINGAQISISGKLVSSDDRWITLEGEDGREQMIAQRDVLSVTVLPP